MSMTSDVRSLEAGDDGFHEIQLNGKQLVFLGMATTLVSVVIFLCGVLVGRGVKPLDTVAQAGGPQAFDAPLSPSVPPGTIATPAPTPPTPATPTAAAAAPAEDEVADDTQPTPLGDDAEAPPAPAPAPAVVPPPAPAPAVKAAATPEPRPTPKPEVKPSPKPAQVAAVPPPAAPAPAVTPVPAASGSGKIAVQVGAFKTRPEADALARRLSGRGYSVYIVNPSDERAVYRVRVGNYASAEEAQRVSARLTQQEKVKTWITR